MISSLSLDKSIDIELLDCVLNSIKCQSFQKKSKIPIDLSCHLCIITSNCKKSKQFNSVDSLLRHIFQVHQVEPRLDNRTKEEYVKGLYSLSVILETLHNALGSDYHVILKTFQEMVQKGIIK